MPGDEFTFCARHLRVKITAIDPVTSSKIVQEPTPTPEDPIVFQDNTAVTWQLKGQSFWFSLFDEFKYGRIQWHAEEITADKPLDNPDIWGPEPYC